MFPQFPTDRILVKIFITNVSLNKEVLTEF